jgi:hypothetical protein
MSVTLAEPLELTESGNEFIAKLQTSWRVKQLMFILLGILPRQPVNAQLFSRSEEKNGTRQIRPFKCLLCGAAFKKSAHLKFSTNTYKLIRD